MIRLDWILTKYDNWISITVNTLPIKLKSHPAIYVKHSNKTGSLDSQIVVIIFQITSRRLLTSTAFVLAWLTWRGVGTAYTSGALKFTPNFSWDFYCLIFSFLFIDLWTGSFFRRLLLVFFAMALSIFFYMWRLNSSVDVFRLLFLIF